MAEPREEPHTTRAHELRQLLAVGAPCVYGKIFGFWCPAFITLVCVGRSGELAAVGLAMSYSNALGFSINVGLSQAIDSLCSQAYGAGAYLLLGDVLQRALLVMAAFNGGATLLWLCAEGVLVACGQDPLLSASAAAYLRALLPALWAHALSIATQRWLGAQGETRPLLAISTLTLCAHAALAPVLTREGRLGFVGAAVSWSVASTLRAGLTVVFAVAWPKLHVCWGGWSARAALDLDELRRFLGLGLPSVMMLCTEWWAFELVAFMAGLLPDPRAALQAYALLFNVSNLLFMIPLGLGVGTAVRVGQALGRGEPRRARRTVAIALSADACAFGLAACALLSPPVRTHIAALFLGPAASTQRSAAGGASASALVAAVLPWVVLGQLGDNIKEICNGVLRGAGRQALGAWTAATCYPFVMLPCSALLAFGHGPRWCAGLTGLFAGIVLGSAAHAASNLGLVLGLIDFRVEAERAMSTAKHSEERRKAAASRAGPKGGGAGGGGQGGAENGGVGVLAIAATSAGGGGGGVDSKLWGSPPRHRGGNEEPLLPAAGGAER